MTPRLFRLLPLLAPPAPIAIQAPMNCYSGGSALTPLFGAGFSFKINDRVESWTYITLYRRNYLYYNISNKRQYRCVQSVYRKNVPLAPLAPRPEVRARLAYTSRRSVHRVRSHRVPPCQ